MRIPSGVTDQYIYFVAVDSTDFTSRETGLTPGSFTVYRSRNGGAATAMTTPTVAELSAANMPGVYSLLLDEDMTIGSGNDSEEMVFHISYTGMAPVTRTIELYRPKITAGYTLGVASDGDISGNVDGAVASVTGAVGSVTGNVGGNVTGSVGSVTGAVGSVTGNVGGNVTGSVGSISGVTFPSNFADLAITVTTGRVDVASIEGADATDQINAACDTAISDASLATAAALAIVDGNVDLILADTADMQPKLGTITDLGSGATVAGNLSDMAGGTFSSATDSLEAIRDRGDAAWTTGAGGSPPQLLQTTTIATLATQTSFTLTAGSADDDAYNGAIAVITDSATSTQKAVGEVSDYTGSTKTVTLSADPGIFTMAVGDTIEIIAALGAAGSGATAAEVWTYGTRVLTANTNLNDPTAAAIADAVWDEAASGHVGAGTFGAQCGTDIDSILTNTGNIETDTQDLQTQIGTAGAGLTAVPWNASWDAEVQSECADALTAYDPPTQTELTAAFTEIKGATWSAATDTLEHIRDKETDIETDTQDLQTQVGTAGAGLTAVAWNAAWDAEVQSECTDALNAYDPPTRAELTSDIGTVTTAISALNDLAVSDIFTTQLTESYASAGVAPTLAQAIFLIQQVLTEFAINSTTLTVKKLDGSTTAASLTLNDGTSPTSLSRS